MAKAKQPTSKKYQEKAAPEHVISVVAVEEDTTIETLWGPALVTVGNFVVTEADGSVHGIAAADLESLYELVKK